MLQNVSQALANQGFAHNNCTQQAHFIDKLISRYCQRGSCTSVNQDKDHGFVTSGPTSQESGLSIEEDTSNIYSTDSFAALFGPSIGSSEPHILSPWWSQPQGIIEEPWSAFSIDSL